MGHKEVYTFCFFTKFVCRYDELPEAKMRHIRCVDALRDHFKYNVIFCSEQAYQMGRSEPIFSLLLTEIVGNDSALSDQEIEDYSTFCFATIIDVPYDTDSPEKLDDQIRTISIRLEIDFEEGFPARFPSRTRGIMVSPTGTELEGCIYQ